MERVLKKYQNKALSDKEMLNIVDGKANLVLYPNLHKYKSLDQFLQIILIAHHLPHVFTDFPCF